MTLKSDITNDLDTFLNTDEFADTATFGSTNIDGIFDGEFDGVDILTGEIETKKPQFVTKSSNVTSLSIVHGSSCTINSTTYYVTGVQPDGTGITTLILSKDAP